MKVLICGSLCNLDLAFGELLSRYGFAVTVARGKFDPEFNPGVLPDDLQYLQPDQVVLTTNPKEFQKLINRSDLVISITGGVIRHYRKLWPLAPFFIKKPLISVGTGSDFAELLPKRTLLARVYRVLLRRSVFIVSHPYERIVRNLTHFGFSSKTVYARYPYFLHPHIDRENLIDEIKILHVTNFDWGETDNAPGRNSFKGNQIFISGILDSFRRGFQGICTVSFRGSDRHLARRWIESSDFSGNFKWVEQVTSRELRELILSSDIIVDQFAGAFGMIAYESMSLGTPVILSLDQEYLTILYPDELKNPAFNLKTAQELTDFFLSITRKEIARRGLESELWVRRNHDVHTADFSDLVRVMTEAVKSEK
jgi:hypothetical protein